MNGSNKCLQQEIQQPSENHYVNSFYSGREQKIPL